MKTRLTIFVVVMMLIVSLVACNGKHRPMAPTSPSADLSSPDSAVPEFAPQNMPADLIIGGEVNEGDVLFATLDGEKRYFDMEQIRNTPGSDTINRLQAYTYPFYTPWVNLSKSGDGNVGKLLCNGDSACLRSRFASKIGSGSTIPIGFCANTSFWGSGSNPCDDGIAGWTAGKLRLKINTPGVTTTKVVATSVPGYNTITQFNGSNEWKDVPQFAPFGSASSFSHAFAVSVTEGASVSAKFGLPLVGETTVQVSLSSTQSWTDTTVKTKSESYPSPVGLRIPPNGKVIYTLREGYDNKLTTWTVPLELSGVVGADYGAGKWNGHYYWAINATAMWPEYAAGTEKGTIQKVQYLNHSIWVRAKVYYSNGTLYRTIGNIR
jgi:hypothetical protein